jgi:hypothetical protein
VQTPTHAFAEQIDKDGDITVVGVIVGVSLRELKHFRQSLIAHVLPVKKRINAKVDKFTCTHTNKRTELTETALHID